MNWRRIPLKFFEKNNEKVYVQGIVLSFVRYVYFNVKIMFQQIFFCIARYFVSFSFSNCYFIVMDNLFEWRKTVVSWYLKIFNSKLFLTLWNFIFLIFFFWSISVCCGFIHQELSPSWYLLVQS